MQSLYDFLGNQRKLESHGTVADAHAHLRRLGFRYIKREGCFTYYETRKKRAYVTDESRYSIYA